MVGPPLNDKTARQPGWRREVTVYLLHIVALFRPGHPPPKFDTVGDGPAAETGSLEHWGEEDFALLIDEGRRSFDVQASRFDRVRTTTQVILPTGTALLVLVGTALGPIHAESTTALRWIYYVLWAFALFLVLLAVLGSAAILVTRVSFGAVLPTLTSQQQPPIAEALAKAYATQFAVGENSVNTKLTLHWWSVSFLAAGGLIYVVVWFMLNL